MVQPKRIAAAVQADSEMLLYFTSTFPTKHNSGFSINSHDETDFMAFRLVTERATSDLLDSSCIKCTLIASPLNCETTCTCRVSSQLVRGSSNSYSNELNIEFDSVKRSRPAEPLKFELFWI